jgi:hypothetical protein
MGFEPMNNGFAGRRVSHFATRAHLNYSALHLDVSTLKDETHCLLAVGSTRLITSSRSINSQCQR